MADFLSAYSIQQWLESAPQGYLMKTEYGHPEGEREPDLIVNDRLLNEQAIRTTVQLVMGERCALAASSGLINAAPDEGSKRKAELEDVLQAHANPNLVKFAEVLLEKVDKKDFVAGVVGQNIVLEGMAFHVFEMLKAANEELNPKFAHTLSGTIADERRHVGFGENRIGSLIREHPERKPEIERMQKEMSYYMLATFADSFRDGPAQEEMDRLRGRSDGGSAVWQGVNLGELGPEEMEAVLADTVLKEFKLRLERVGIEYQTPVRP
jgi:hypothetical protein